MLLRKLFLSQQLRFCLSNNTNIFQCSPVFCRLITSSGLNGERLVASENGEPADVIKKESYKLDVFVSAEKTIVKVLAAPINPVDVNIIQGVYGIKLKLPMLPGMEGVGVVQRVGSGSNPFGLKEGSWVIPRRLDVDGGGTWQSYLIGDNEAFLPIPNTISLEAAATISINPATAYRMLKDFEKLSPGDTVIQNGGNSGVGQAVIQLCKEFGLNSISIVRNRDNIQELKAYLTKLGDSNTFIVTEEEFKENIKKKKLPTAKLALNCIGGKSAIDVTRLLEPERTLVTYGGMSKQPVIISTAQLIFNDIKCVGFAIGRWNELNPVETRIEMLNHIAKLCLEGKFVPPETKIIPIANFMEALDNNPLKGFVGKKYIFSFQ